MTFVDDNKEDIIEIKNILTDLREHKLIEILDKLILDCNKLEKTREYRKQYRLENKKHLIPLISSKMKERYHSDPEYRQKINRNNRIHKLIKTKKITREEAEKIDDERLKIRKDYNTFITENNFKGMPKKILDDMIRSLTKIKIVNNI